MTTRVNKITLEHITKLVDKAESQEHVFWDKELVVSYKLYNGFTVLGRSACVDPANFVLEKGRQVARDNAISQLWQLEGYLLQEDLYREKSKWTGLFDRLYDKKQEV